MKVKPAPGQVLIQMVAPDFIKRGKLFEPKERDKKDTMFSNRALVIDLGAVDDKAGQQQNEWLKVGMIAIISSHAIGVGVTGAMRREHDGKWIDVALVPRWAFLAEIVGDLAEDLDTGTGSLISDLPAGFDEKMSKLKIH